MTINDLLNTPLPTAEQVSNFCFYSAVYSFVAVLLILSLMAVGYVLWRWLS